jgi:hypothetical protein
MLESLIGGPRAESSAAGIGGAAEKYRAGMPAGAMTITLLARN